MENKGRLITLQKIGIISSFIAFSVFVLGTTIAMIIYPDYSFLNQFLSELGIRINVTFSDGGSMVKAPFPEVFNISLIITGILIIPFFPVTYFILKPKGTIRKIIQLITGLSGVVTGIFISGVGIFDAGMFIEEHVVAAIGLYYCMIITILLWVISILFLNRDSPYKLSKWWIVDPVASVICMLVAAINLGLFGLNEIFVGRLTLAFYQKSLAYLFILFFGFVAIRLYFLHKNVVSNLTQEAY